MIFDSNQPWMLSANGTIFTYENEGIIPGLLTRWYSERKVLQKQLKQSTNKEEQEFLDKRQLVRKILLNSAYGALLNAHCRFYDKRIGQSTTLTGRQIVKHMSAHLNEAICGEYDHTGEAIIYNDTDSAYFTAMPMINRSEEMKAIWNKDVAIQIYDELAANTNSSFPEFMERAFHCPRKNGEIIKAGREIVADRGLFVKKKKYAVRTYDKEGKRYDKDGKLGKIKVTGFDMKRSDTPKFVQIELEAILEMVLDGAPKELVIERMKEFKKKLREMDPWTKGSPKGVRKVTEYTAALEKAKNGKGSMKVNMPGHTRASLNWNYLRKMNGDNYSQKIIDGMKIVVCKLKNNSLEMTSVAYPKDELRLPKWFLDLPFDDAEMERVLFDEKVENMLAVLNWDLRKNTDINSTFGDLFSFG
jgi:DNA polymerase elongation subunit (family B)